MTEISRSAQVARLGTDVVSVKDFGAKGDGVTDDTAAIQAALDSMNNTQLDGGHLILPSGSYKLTSSLTVSANLWIQGEGEKTFIDATSIPNGNCFVFNAPTFLDDLRISDMRIRGNSANNDTDANTGNAIFIEGSSANNERLKFFNLRIERFKIGIHIESSGVSESPTVRDCWIEECSRAAIYIVRSSGALIEGNTIEPSRSGVGDEVAGLIAIWFVSGNVASMNTLSKISNNTVLSATTLETINIKGFNTVVDGNTMVAGDCGVMLEAANTASLPEHGDLYGTISNNFIEGAEDYGVVLRQDPANADFLSVSHCAIVGNTIKDCRIGVGVGQLQAEVTVYPTFNLVANNNIYGSTDAALLLSAAKDTTVSGNNCHSSNSHGIILQGVCERSIITGGRVTAPDSGSFGLLINAASLQTKVDGVYFHDCGLQAIRPTGSCDGVYVDNCVFDDTGYGVAVGSATNVYCNNNKGVNLTNPLVVGQSDPQVQQFGNINIFTGTGSPEGSVTANVGDQFNRTDGGAGTTLYIKETGTGNTGWSAK